MTIRKAPITGKNQHGAHTPRGNLPRAKRGQQDRSWTKQDIAAIRAYVSKLNKSRTFWVVDSRSDGRSGYLVWLSWDQHEANRRRTVQRRKKPQK